MAGMHRSGTSAVARTFALLGFALPKNLYPAAPDNPSGYWEPLRVVEADEAFLESLGSGYDDVEPLDEEALLGEAGREHAARIAEILADEYGDAPRFVVKDPRICRLVPVWIDAVRRVGAEPHFVLPLRNPLEVAASLKLRNDFSATKSLLLWLRHVLEAELHTRASRRAFVSYEDLLRDWRAAARKLESDLSLPLLRSSSEVEAEVQRFLTSRSRHHAYDVESLAARPEIAAWVKDAYRVLCDAAAGNRLDEEALDGIRENLAQAQLVFGPLAAEERLASAEARAELDAGRARLSEARAELDVGRAQLGEAREELVRANAEATAAQERADMLEDEVAEARAASEGLERALADRDRQLRELAERVTELEAARDDLALLVDDRNRALAAQKKIIDSLARRRIALRRPAGGSAGEAARPAPSLARLAALRHFASWLLRPGRGGHELVRRYFAVRRSGVFDARYYLDRYPDVAQAGFDPLMHFVEHGMREGREASAGLRLELPAAAPEAEAEGARAGPDVVAQPAPVPAPPEARAPVPPVPRASVPARAPIRPRAAVGPTQQDDVVVLLGRQRSGTNALRSILDSNPDIHCFAEVFNFGGKESPEPARREANFFTFLERYGQGDVQRLFPNNHERMFLDYLEYLRCLSPKKLFVVDVKYNTTHLLGRPWEPVGHPYLFELVKRHRIRVLRITRRNYLRYVLSAAKAWRSDRYVVDELTPYADTAQTLDVDELLSTLERCEAEDELVSRALGDHDRCVTYDYVDVFPGTAPVSPAVLEDVSAWLGVQNDFAGRPSIVKQATLPLDETIVNFGEVEAALRETRFAYCLDDEPVYREPDGAPAAADGGGDGFRPGAPTRRRPLETLDGRDVETFCNAFMKRVPPWVAQGSISWDDAYFLVRETLASVPGPAVEIGTASGVSTALICQTLDAQAAAGAIEPDWRLTTYDILESLYFDPSRAVGEAAREMLPDELLRRIAFRAPADARDAAREHDEDEVTFLFLDANHSHPWPTLDLMAMLGVLRPGAIVVLHDVNLPVIHPEYQTWGVKWLFDALTVTKRVAGGDESNIGSLVVPYDKAGLRRQLETILYAWEWEASVPEEAVREITERPASATA